MSNSDDLMSIIAYYLQQQQAGKTPNTYQVPPTPGEAYDLAHKKQVDSFVGPYIQQQLAGTGNLNPTNFSFMSPALKGQTFAGGIKAPNIDFTKIPGFGAPSPGGTTAPSPVTPAGGGSSSSGGGTNGNAPDAGGQVEPQTKGMPRVPSLVGDVGSAFASPQPFNQLADEQAASSSLSGDTNSPTGAGLIKQAQTLAQQVRSGLKTIEQVFAEHPWLTKLGGAVLGAIFGGPAGAFAGYKGAGTLIDAGNKPATPPTPPVTQPLPPGDSWPSTIHDRRFTPGAP